MRTTLIALTIALSSLACANSRPVTIVRDGKSDYVIAIPANPSPAETLAAEELAKYLRQMSGAELPVQRGGNVPPRAIKLESRFSKLPVPLGSYEITTNRSRIEVIGERGGLLYGTYAFLDLLGCRFLAPRFDHYKGAAEVIPQSKTIVFSSEEPVASAPKLAYRKLYIEEGISHDESNLKQLIEWMPKVGYNILVCPLDYGAKGRVRWDNWRNALTSELGKRSIIIEVGGHGYENFLNAEMEGGKLFEQYPEWFGQDETGSRRKGKAFVFCTSNSQAVEFVTRNFLSYVRQRPEIEIFDFWPPDGAKWCACGPCAALGEPPERQAKLISHVSGEVAKELLFLKLEAIAYSKLIDPPEVEKINSNVLIDFCPIAQNFEFTIDDPAGHGMREDGSAPRANKQYFDALRAWRERFEGPISIYSYYRRYAWDSLPVTLPWHMKHEMAWYASIPTQGISTYSEPGDWFAYELNHYVLPALAWDQDQDVDALVKKFADARYGTDASPVAQLTYTTLADVVRKYCSVPFVSLKSEAEIDAAKRMDAVAKELDAAQSSAKDDVVKRHLERLGLVVEYVRRDLAVQKMRAAKAPREQIRERIAADHKWLSDHANDGVFLVKGNRLTLNRAYARYGVNDKAPTTSPAE